jgi:type IV pilus assembly protein PilA
MKNQKGFSLIELLVVVIIIAIVAAIAIPNLLASRRAANEASAISSLRSIHSAQAVYFSTAGANSVYGTLGSLMAANVALIDSTLGSGTKSGYDFTVTIGAANSNLYCADAVPDTATTGTRTFAIGASGVIYGWAAAGGDAACGAAGAFDPTGGTQKERAHPVLFFV